MLLKLALLVFRCALHYTYGVPCSRKDRGPALTRAAELHSSTSALRREARFGFAAFAGGFKPFGALRIGRVVRVILQSNRRSSLMVDRFNTERVAYGKSHGVMNGSGPKPERRRVRRRQSSAVTDISTPPRARHRAHGKSNFATSISLYSISVTPRLSLATRGGFAHFR